jgi:hypothetical protein
MQKTSRELAAELIKYAEFLLSKPEFDLDGIAVFNKEFSLMYYNKELFVAAAKALGNATKSYDGGEYANFNLTSTEVPVRLSISRDKVCRKVVSYECEPLFSAEEVEAL